MAFSYAAMRPEARWHMVDHCPSLPRLCPRLAAGRGPRPGALPHRPRTAAETRRPYQVAPAHPPLFSHVGVNQGQVLKAG
jgi:hypothetical protein